MCDCAVKRSEVGQTLTCEPDPRRIATGQGLKFGACEAWGVQTSAVLNADMAQTCIKGRPGCFNPTTDRRLLYLQFTLVALGTQPQAQAKHVDEPGMQRTQ